MKDLASIPLPILDKSGPLVEPKIESLRASDGIQLACRFWKGKSGAPVVLYLHGIEGHSQWFENTASFLNNKGITVYAPDRRGSGLNKRDRGHLTDYKVLLADIEGILRKIQVDHAGHAVVMIGACWGAKAAATIAAADYKPQEGGFTSALAGLALICPALYTKVDFDLKAKLTIGYNRLMGDRRALKKWPIPVVPTMFTDNPVYLEYIEKDPLRLTEATSSFFFETMRLSKLAESAASNTHLPLLILQSGADQIVDVKKVEDWYSKAKSADKTMRIFPDAYHNLDFDATWFRDYSHLLSEWILARSPVVT